MSDTDEPEVTATVTILEPVGRLGVTPEQALADVRDAERRGDNRAIYWPYMPPLITAAVQTRSAPTDKLAGFGDVFELDELPTDLAEELADGSCEIVPLVSCRRCGCTVAHRLAPAGVATLVLCEQCRGR